ncbi:PaaI family thioesterase [Citromicrobium sp. JLT1363]|uniref:PaaI family thioesterase n=1 Tax=Citromicrobium sp. JLT1363 TaxID=517722 RepID=UPI00030679C7|nr:PaaI family thioesterase [Citromicrobium sp. JLT1363]
MEKQTSPSDTFHRDPGAVFDPAAASPFLLSGGHPGWLGLAYRDHGPDWVELVLPWREELMGDDVRRVIASGPIFSMLDMAGGMAIWAHAQRFVPVATLDMRVDYQRPAGERADVIGRCECYRTTRSAAFVRGIAHDGDPDDPVATMAAVYMTIGGAPKND